MNHFNRVLGSTCFAVSQLSHTWVGSEPLAIPPCYWFLHLSVRLNWKVLDSCLLEYCFTPVSDWWVRLGLSCRSSCSTVSCFDIEWGFSDRQGWYIGVCRCMRVSWSPSEIRTPQWWMWLATWVLFFLDSYPWRRPWLTPLSWRVGHLPSSWVTEMFDNALILQERQERFELSFPVNWVCCYLSSSPSCFIKLQYSWKLLLCQFE